MEPIRGKTEIIDPFYRYKMEKMVFRVERTKTSIMNLDKIASSLKIPSAECIVIFFKKRLAMQMIQCSQGLIISRHVDLKIIQDTLYEFIDFFVLCKNCNLPELAYVVRNKQIVTDCASCGTTNEIKKNQYSEPVMKYMKTTVLPEPNISKNQLIKDMIPCDSSLLQSQPSSANNQHEIVDGVKKKKKKKKHQKKHQSDQNEDE